MRRLIYIIFVLSLFSCREEPTSWDLDYYGPLAQGRLNFADLVEDSLLTADNAGLVSLSSSLSFDPTWADTLTTIPDTVIHKSFDTGFGLSVNVPPGISFITQEGDSRINAGEAELRYIKVRAGTLNYVLRSYIDGFINYTYSLPGTFIDNQVVGISGLASPGNEDDPYVHSGSIDISGAQIDLRGESGISFNKLTTALEIITSEDHPEGVQLYGFDSLTVDLNFEDVEIEYARGFFGTYEITQESFESLQFMSAFTDGYLEPEALELEVSMPNTVGVDVQMSFNSLIASNTGSGEEVELSSPELDQSFNLARAIDQDGEIQVVDELSILMDEGNSNLVELISILPDEIRYDVDFNINPLGDISSGNDFIYTDRAFAPAINFNVPLCFAANNLTLQDTLDITSDLSENAVSGTLLLSADNRFPFQTSFFLSIINDDGEHLYELADNTSIYSADLNEQGYAELPMNSENTFDLNEELLSLLTPENKLLIKVILNTANGTDPVKIYEDYSLDVILKADVRTTITVE